ncbi:MAG: FtsK/SpoIIIE domain-containing protein, partial [Bifidobacterium sp.]|nr:FtsK/SpoIIIE domain-containing protein [Bifidobacterium sp.]
AATLAAAAPLAAQAVMLAALLLRRQWLFALMVGAGVLGTAAALSSTLRRHRASPPDGADDPSGHAVDGTAAPDATPTDRHGDGRPPSGAPTPPAAFPATSLEELLGLEEDAAPFRTIAHLWACAEPGCAARVGVDAHGRPLAIDLARHGPHAMVAATTGSGKSVLLQDWCLSLAATYPPTRLQFVLLDFKGGSAMDLLAGLPHVRGCVNDLDLAYAVRALLALERELTRRERLAARLGCADLMACAQAPARLLIVVDEFHMLHGQLPDYLDRLVRVASLGRSLGMHLVACTQNPLAQISGSMKANLNCRVCLRVRDGTQSAEMVGTQEAARLPPSAPGLAIVSHGEGPTMFRCAALGAPRELVGHIAACARFHGTPSLRPLFTAPLPARVEPAALEDA